MCKIDRTGFSSLVNYRGEGEENHEVCPSDCLSGGRDSLCEKAIDGVCDLDCTSDFECDNELSDEVKQNLINNYKEEFVKYKNPAIKDRINFLESKSASWIGRIFLLLFLVLLLFLICWKFFKKEIFEVFIQKFTHKI